MVLGNTVRVKPRLSIIFSKNEPARFQTDSAALGLEPAGMVFGELRALVNMRVIFRASSEKLPHFPSDEQARSCLNPR